MDMKNLQKDPESLKIMQAIGAEMQNFFKREKDEKAKNFKFLNQFAVKGQILFTGSSLMEQFPVAELAKDHGIDKIIYNRGIGGYTTDEFMEEIDTVLFDLEPSKLFINIGTNDMNEREGIPDWNAHLLTNYETILKQIKERLPECEVYMMAYYPVNPTVAKEDFAKQALKIRTKENLDMVNRQLAELAAKYQYHFIDANEGLCNENGELKAEFTKEGMHMFANAYEVVFNNLKKYI